MRKAAADDYVQVVIRQVVPGFERLAASDSEVALRDPTRSGEPRYSHGNDIAGQDDDIDVDDRLSWQAGHRRAADVIRGMRHVRESDVYGRPDYSELLWPPRLIVHYHCGRLPTVHRTDRNASGQRQPDRCARLGNMTSSWDDAYTGAEPPPWDIGRPQPAFARLAQEGLLSGLVLDAGCGTGENALAAASHGASVTGVDLSPVAIARARAKAADRGVTARFDVGDALDLPSLGLAGQVHTIIDSGVFHVFSDEDRPRYVASIASALHSGGMVFLMCFSDRQPGNFGPRRVRQDEIRAAFSDGWTVQSISADEFNLNPLHGMTRARAWLAILKRD